MIIIIMTVKSCKNSFVPNDCNLCEGVFFETFCMCPLRNEEMTDEIYEEIYEDN